MYFFTSLTVLLHVGISSATSPDVLQTLNVDFTLLDTLDPIPTPDIPVVYRTARHEAAVTKEVVTYDSKSAARAVATAVKEHLKSSTNEVILLDDSLSFFQLQKRELVNTNSGPSPSMSTVKQTKSTTQTYPSICVPQPTGSGPMASPDTPQAFLKDKRFSDAALANDSVAPAGYVKTFADLKASNNAYGYMGYTLLDSYNVSRCGAKCTLIPGCRAFNIYFERDPIVDPTSPACDDPGSTTNIKCVFWGGPVSSRTAVNDGQWRGNFHVVIAGSSGYTNRSVSTPKGYTELTYLGRNAINAPVCSNQPNPLLESKTFVAQAFDVGLCATACSEQHAWARGRQKVRQCNFWNTYILYKDNNVTAQWCALYEESWPMSLAVNNGYDYAGSHYSIGFSYSSSNVKNVVLGNTSCLFQS